MRKFNCEEIVRIIDTLNGRIDPVGETNTDNQRYENLKELEIIIACLLDNIQLLIPNKDSYEYSVKRAGIEAVTYLKTIIENINDWFKDYGVEE